MSAKRLALPGAVALVAVTLIVALVRRSDSNSVSARAQRLEHRIACWVCVGESVAESNASASVEARADIERRLRAGESDEEIVGYYAARRPDKILTPPDSGLGLIAWGLPVVALILASGGLVLALRRWRAEPLMVATAEDEALVERARKQS